MMFSSVIQGLETFSKKKIHIKIGRYYMISHEAALYQSSNEVDISNNRSTYCLIIDEWKKEKTHKNLHIKSLFCY